MPQHQYLRDRRRINDRNPAVLSVQNLCKQYGVDAVLEAVLKDECGCPPLLGYARALVAAVLLDRRFLAEYGRHLQVSLDDQEGDRDSTDLNFHEFVVGEEASLDGRMCRLNEVRVKAEKAAATGGGWEAEDEARRQERANLRRGVDNAA